MVTPYGLELVDNCPFGIFPLSPPDDFPVNLKTESQFSNYVYRVNSRQFKKPASLSPIASKFQVVVGQAVERPADRQCYFDRFLIGWLIV